MSNLLDLFYFAGDRVDYVVVHNPAKVRTNLFKKSNIEAELKKFGAKELTLPVVTSITLLAIKRAEAKAGRKLSFAEVATPGASHLELMLAGEMQWAMQQMFRQSDAIADLLVPLEQVPEVESQPEPEGTHPLQTTDVQFRRMILWTRMIWLRCSPAHRLTKWTGFTGCYMNQRRNGQQFSGATGLVDQGAMARRCRSAALDE